MEMEEDMKKRYLSLFTVSSLIVFLTLPLVLAAQEEEEEKEVEEKESKLVVAKPPKIEVGLMGGVQSFDSDAVGMLKLGESEYEYEIGDGTLYGFRFGYLLKPKFELEFSFRRTETSLRSPTRKFLDNDLRIEVTEAALLYNFKGDRPWKNNSFLLGALGVVKADPVDPTFDFSHRYFRELGFGAGARHFFNDHFGLRIDARCNSYTTSDFSEWDNVNLEVNFSVDFIH